MTKDTSTYEDGPGCVRTAWSVFVLSVIGAVLILLLSAAILRVGILLIIWVRQCLC